MACNFKTTSAGTSIKRKVGANNARFVALVSLISNPETGGFTDEFVKYYQKVNHTEELSLKLLFVIIIVFTLMLMLKVQVLIMIRM